MNNLIDVLDERGIRTGECLDRATIHKLGKIHRAVHLFLFNQNNELLIQQRSANVDHFPEAWGISLTAHIDSGECSSDALYREVHEELGLNPNKMKIDFLFSFRQDLIISPTYIDRQFIDVYTSWHTFEKTDIRIDSNEVNKIELIPFNKFLNMVDNQKEGLGTVYGTECQEVTYFLKIKR